MPQKPPPTALSSSYPCGAHWDSMYLHREGELSTPQHTGHMDLLKGGLIHYAPNITVHKELIWTPLIPFGAGKHIAHLQTHPSVGMQGYLDSPDSNPSVLPSRQWPGMKNVLACPPCWLKGLCIPQRDLSCPMLESGKFLPSHRGLCSDQCWDL